MTAYGILPADSLSASGAAVPPSGKETAFDEAKRISCEPDVPNTTMEELKALNSDV